MAVKGKEHSFSKEDCDPSGHCPLPLTHSRLKFHQETAGGP